MEIIKVLFELYSKYVFLDYVLKWMVILDKIEEDLFH